ncbi:metallophosphoesterase [Simplicispira metamorpha]|uniref:Calcineurin-like phosphoesterase family protein n=1 Tax=Simplicispira metamorpha TaxID=80881 RepID=A0A4V2SJJ8_9BURK|nr:metallophosphoesterase [Simplicispira metamorpha]TCP15956.1 calcineurin-like phosphoesterase family protein [Simplicispira metamorpha]
MSKLAVVHLSDIHVHGDTDQCLEAAERIAAACFEHVRGADGCLVAITGDVAFSGAEHEYQAVENHLLGPLLSSLAKETGQSIYVSVAPGNHDCVLKPVDDVRETLIGAIVESPSKANKEVMVEACTGVQNHFFKFAERSLSPVPTMPSRLFWQQRFAVGGQEVLVSTLNAAWMSRLPEPQGQLVFPVERFDRELETDAALHLALVHHPFNWYSQAAYQNLRKRLRTACTAVLSGHEHEGNVGKVEEQVSGVSLFFEATALQPHEPGAQAGFSIHVFDLDAKEVESYAFHLTVSEVEAVPGSSRHSWKEKRTSAVPELTATFAAVLNDAGGNFSHTAKERLTLEDIFVWPDLRDWDSQDVNRQKTKSAIAIIPELLNGNNFIIYGDEKAGKTTLVYSYFRELISRGYFPVYLAGHSLTIKSKDDAERRINKAIEEQYTNSEAIRRIPREKRILILDDVDRLKSGVHTLPTFLDFADKHFVGVFLTACTGFEVANLASKEAMTVLSPFKSHDLMPFGLKLRHKLIKKWCELAPVTTSVELDRRVVDVESIVNSVIGKRLVPEYPLYLLILLQSSEQHRHGEIQNSGLSFYYQYLITKSLGSVGVKPTELDEHFNYLSLLAWRFRLLKQRELDEGQLRAANKEFSDRFVTVDFYQRLDLLTKARVLYKRGDCYSFAYPYVYYFFLGRYLAKNLDQQEVRELVEECCKKLYLRDCAHTVMFLAHHVENSWLIGLICEVLRNCFSEKKPVELNGDTSYINSLVQQSAQLRLPAPDVNKNQSDIREIQDSLLDSEPNDDTEDYSALSFASKWNLLHKTAEILGLILTNYYGSLERTRKQEMIREVFDGPLRALRLWLEEVAADLPSLVSYLKDDALAKNPKRDAVEVEIEIKRRIFNIFGWVATGAIASCGSFVSAEKLREDMATVVETNPTNAYRLIEASARLLKPGKVPMDRVKKLAQDLEKNPYAFGVLQTLGFYHMYMFHTDEPQKQALCSVLKISFGQAKAIEVRKPGRTLR